MRKGGKRKINQNFESGIFLYIGSRGNLFRFKAVFFFTRNRADHYGLIFLGLLRLSVSVTEKFLNSLRSDLMVLVLFYGFVK